MEKIRLYLLAAAVLGCGFLLFASGTPADSLTGSVDIRWVFPTTSGTFATDIIAVGSSLTCPGSSNICLGYQGGTQDFTVGGLSITYKASNTINSPYASTAFNGFDFGGLTFLSGGTLAGFTLTTDIAGLTSSDVTFGLSDVVINLAGLSANGDFTLDLVPSTPAVPEPSSMTMLATGLLAMVAFILVNRARYQ